MSKEKNKNNKDFAYVTLVGTVVWSDVVRYNENKKELHNYFVQIKEPYKDKEGNEKEKKFSFKCTHFGRKRNSDIFLKGDRVKIKGFLKINSYKNEEGEWINQTYISISEIDYAE